MDESAFNELINSAEEEFHYVYNMELNDQQRDAPLTVHSTAIIILFNHFLHLRLKVQEVVQALARLPEWTELYKVLIEPFLSLVDDIEFIARKYGRVYLQYLSEKAKGKDDEEIVMTIFATCPQIPTA
jgi:hypothetical protein